MRRSIHLSTRSNAGCGDIKPASSIVIQNRHGRDGRCFLAAQVVSKSIVEACMLDRNKICQNGRAPTHLDVQPGPANRQTSFSGRGDACGSNLPIPGHIVKPFRRPSILQANIEGLTASKMHVQPAVSASRVGRLYEQKVSNKKYQKVSIFYCSCKQYRKLTFARV